MQSVKSTQVQKPVLQTAIAPQVPTTTSTTSIVPSYPASVSRARFLYPPLTHRLQIYQIVVCTFFLEQNNTPPTTPPVLNPSQISPSIINGNTVHQSSSTSNILPVNEPPSYASTMAFKASQQHPRHLPPPPCMYTTHAGRTNATRARRTCRLLHSHHHCSFACLFPFCPVRHGAHRRSFKFTRCASQ